MSATIASHAKHDVARLEGRIRELHGHLKGLTQDEDMNELLRIIHRPGWTTVAEFMLVEGLVEAIHTQVAMVNGLKQTLMNGSRIIGTE